MKSPNPKTIDINCDMGESYGQFKVGNDAAIFPYISSCNIACGFHGGDPLHIERTIKSALAHKVRIGAHPAYPDLAGFGRRKMQLPKEELVAIIKYQVAALKGMTESLGGRLAYVKPHGALYNTAASHVAETIAIIEAIQAVDPNLALMGLAGSVTEQVAKERKINFIAEAFADRQYTADGRLMARSQEGAVIHEPMRSAAQVWAIISKQEVPCAAGHFIPMQAQSICIHGDNLQAVAILQAIDLLLEQNGIRKQ